MRTLLEPVQNWNSDVANDRTQVVSKFRSFYLTARPKTLMKVSLSSLHRNFKYKLCVYHFFRHDNGFCNSLCCRCLVPGSLAHNFHSCNVYCLAEPLLVSASAPRRRIICALGAHRDPSYPRHIIPSGAAAVSQKERLKVQARDHPFQNSLG